MNPGNPWIDATLEGFPEDDPKNPKRRHLLEEAAASLPPAWHHPERTLPDPPEELKSTTSWISRNLSASFLITLGVSLLVLPNLNGSIATIRDSPFRDCPGKPSNCDR